MALSQISGTTGIADTSITSAKLADFSAAVDLNGVELLLDADQDTSITADTDDVIDFKIAGVEHISLSNSSGDTIIKPRVDGKDIIFQQFDGKKLFEINDGNFVSVGGNNAAAGQIRIFEDTDNGSHYSGFTVGNLTESYVLALPNADGSSGQALTTNGSGVLSFTTLSANTPSSADGQALGSASLEWSDLFLADSSTIQFGADQDTILTHTDGSGLTLNSTNKLMFNDASQFIQGTSATVLSIGATDEIDLTATLIDVNGNLDVSGTITIGSAAIAEAELELLDGLTAGTAIASKVVTTDGNIDTSGQRNLTISGELDAATLDISGAIDVAGNSVLASVDVTAVATAATFEPDGDTAAGDNAAIGFTAAEGLILTGQGSTNDVTIKNDADADVIEIPTGTVNVTMAGTLGVTGVVTGAGFTIGSAVIGEAELEILDGATITTTELNLIDGGATVGTTAVADGDGVLHNDGGTMRVTSAATFKTYFQEGISQAYDDFTIGDAAVLITTSSGNITIDAAASDSDIIFKGTDGGADRVFDTFDGSAGGDLFLTGGLIDLKNDGSNVSQIKFYCESSNAHAQTLIGAPHAQSADNTLTLPDGANGVLLSTTSTATVTNKTLTTPKINENVALTSTASELNILDGATVVVGEINALDIGSTAVGTGVASKAVILDSSLDYTGIRNLTITGEIDAATGDFSGAVDIAGATTVVGLTASGAILPAADDATDLGSASKQFRNIYTGDLHLSNMSKAAGNVVDGTKGDWTIQEGAEELYLMNNNSGKKYKFNLTEV